MAREPRANGGNGSGRDARGRFTKGNPGGPGNPYTRQVARLRQALLEALEPEALREVVAALVRAARQGDVPAAKLLLAYAVGRPREMADPELEALRQEVERLRLVVEGEQLEDERAARAEVRSILRPLDLPPA